MACVWRKLIPGGENSQGRCPKEEAGLACLRPVRLKVHQEVCAPGHPEPGKS